MLYGDRLEAGLPNVLAVKSVESDERRQARAHDIGGGVEHGMQSEIPNSSAVDHFG